MCLCPLAAACAETGDEPDEKVHLDRFEEGCQLPQLLRPNETRKMWLMRWRGKNGEMDNEHLVGGEEDLQGKFAFEQDSTSFPNTAFPSHNGMQTKGVKIEFFMVHNDDILHFHGSKTRDLSDDEKPAVPWALERSWQSLNDPEWQRQ
jgi:hypothetical protein